MLRDRIECRPRMRRVVWALCAVGIAPLVSGPGVVSGQTDDVTEYRRKGIELAALYGYQFGGQIDLTSGGEVKLDDQGAFGFILSMPMRDPSTQIELSYSHQKTELTQEDYWGTNEFPLFDMSVDYFQIGGLRGIRKGKAMPFGFGTMGATMFNPKGDEPDAEWRFSITLGVGAKYYMSERMGIRAQFGLLIPMQWDSGSVWCGGGGCVGGVSGGTTFGQGNVSGGLMFLF